MFLGLEIDVGFGCIFAAHAKDSSRCTKWLEINFQICVSMCPALVDVPSGRNQLAKTGPTSARDLGLDLLYQDFLVGLLMLCS